MAVNVIRKARPDGSLELTVRTSAQDKTTFAQVADAMTLSLGAHRAGMDVTVGSLATMNRRVLDRDAVDLRKLPTEAVGTRLNRADATLVYVRQPPAVGRTWANQIDPRVYTDPAKATLHRTVAPKFPEPLWLSYPDLPRIAVKATSLAIGGSVGLSWDMVPKWISVSVGLEGTGKLYGQNAGHFTLKLAAELELDLARDWVAGWATELFRTDLRPLQQEAYWGLAAELSSGDDGPQGALGAAFVPKLHGDKSDFTLEVDTAVNAGLSIPVGMIGPGRVFYNVAGVVTFAGSIRVWFP